MSTDRRLPGRRCVVLGGLAGAAALAGCSDAAPTPDESSAPPGTPASPTTPDTAGEASPLVALADVPVGGAVVVDGADGPVAVARPAEGEAVAYSAVCTHQGCTVAADGDVLRCPCHGSVFEAATGDTVQGPAQRPLDPVAVRVTDGQVLTG